MRWNELSPEARARELRQQYGVAVAAMQSGTDFHANRAKADAAVSALRAEMYGTPSGRKEHERLEQRLEALVERERDRSVPGGER